MDTSGHKTKRHHMAGPSLKVHLNHNSSPYNFLNLIISEEFRSIIFQECTNMRASMEGAGRKGDRDRTNCLDFTPFSRGGGLIVI